MTSEYRHTPVLLAECLEQSNLKPQQTFVDATLGGAGHSLEMAKLIGLPEETNDRIDLRSSEVIVLWGSNPAWSRAGLPTYDYLQCKEAGVKFVCVDPFYTPTAKVLTDDYITTFRITGMSEGKIFRKYVLKNAILPVVTVFRHQPGLCGAGSTPGRRRCSPGPASAGCWWTASA